MSAATGQQAPPLTLDVSLCKACGICIAVCPAHVFDTAEMGEAVVARPEDCTMCLLCELHCPDFAIEVRRREKKRDEEDPAAAHEAHVERVYAALKTPPTSAAEGPDDEACALRHEEH